MPDWGELLVDQLRFMARRDGGEVAYHDMGSGEALTFHEWDARSNALARMPLQRALPAADASRDGGRPHPASQLASPRSHVRPPL